MDTMTDVHRRLALAIEDDLAMIQTPSGFRVSNDRGLLVESETELGVWTKAFEACQRRRAWRAMKVKRKVERGQPLAPFGLDGPDDAA